MTDMTSTAGTAGSTAAAFPVTTAFELPGMVVERNLGITFGLVVRAMGFSKTVAGGISSLGGAPPGGARSSGTPTASA